MGNEILILILNLASHTIKGELAGHIVDGVFGKIEDFPYAVFLTIQNHGKNYKVNQYICGSSILNQAILLTAAHCLEDCNSGSKITAYAGSASKYSGHVRSAIKFIIHQKYDSLMINYDIALIGLNNALKLGQYVRRVALSPKPPYFEPSVIVGWGVTDDVLKTPTEKLRHTNQTVWTHDKCRSLIPTLSAGCLCASGLRNKDHAARYVVLGPYAYTTSGLCSFPFIGDSGGALVVRKYIQIGLVSYSVPEISTTLVVYTDVGYFFYWIQSNAGLLHC